MRRLNYHVRCFMNLPPQPWNFTCRKERRNGQWTAKFVPYISDLWKIINVKTSTIGIHKRDPLLEPVRSLSDMKLLKLIEFQSLFESMCGIRKP